MAEQPPSWACAMMVRCWSRRSRSHDTTKAHLTAACAGLTVCQVLEKFTAIQMLDVNFPTTGGRELVFSRYTQPEADQRLLVAQLVWTLPLQPPPRITEKRRAATPRSARPRSPGSGSAARGDRAGADHPRVVGLRRTV